MRHNVAGRKLGRTSEHRKALFANLATELLRHGQIRTTLAKAKELRGVVEPLITKAKSGTLAARRRVARVLKSDEVLRNLFAEVAPRFKDTPGGYTRVLKAGFRQGDAAPMAIIMLTEGKAPTAKVTAAPPAADLADATPARMAPETAAPETAASADVAATAEDTPADEKQTDSK